MGQTEPMVQPATQRTKGSRVAGFVFCTRRERDAEENVMVKVLECVGAHYEVQEVPSARVYRWCPATVTVECRCGERSPLTSSRTTCCGCGADHTHLVGEVLETHMGEDEGHLPWRSLRSYFRRPKPI